MDVKCKSLTEVREYIDKIDKEIVRLLADRGHLIDQVVDFQPKGTDHDSAQRVLDVIEHVRSCAKEEGLNPQIAEKVYRSVINAFRIEQLLKEIPEYKDLKKSYY